MSVFLSVNGRIGDIEIEWTKKFKVLGLKQPRPRPRFSFVIIFITFMLLLYPTLLVMQGTSSLCGCIQHSECWNKLTFYYTDQNHFNRNQSKFVSPFVPLWSQFFIYILSWWSLVHRRVLVQGRTSLKMIRISPQYRKLKRYNFVYNLFSIYSNAH